MKTLKLSALLILSLFCSLQAVAMTGLPTVEPTPLDSLILQKDGKDKEKVIYTQQKIKIWHKDNQKIKGVFQSLEGDKIVVNTQEGIEKISIDEVQKIQVFHKPFSQVMGVLSSAVGGAGLVLGVISLYSSIVLILNNDIGIIIGILLLIVAVPLLLLGSFLLLLLGAKLFGRKFNLMRKWRIGIKQIL